jgi:LysR family cyn operon transcriptional activator
MDLRRLRTFVTVVEQGTVSSAARTLRITQPALSRQLHELQAEFGVFLFDQVGRRLRLTAQGSELLPAARALLAQADSLVEQARGLSQGDSGELRVGATPHTIANVFPGLLRLFAAKYPRVRVRTVEAGGIAQLELLRRGELHAALAIVEGNEPEFIIHALPTVRLLLAYNPRTNVSLGSEVDVRDLAGIPLLLLKPEFGYRKIFDAMCRLERVVPNIFVESSAPEALLALAREGHGAAVIPTLARIETGSLRVAPLLFRGNPLTVEIGVLWNRYRQLPRYAEAFSATLSAHLRTVMWQSAPGDNASVTTGTFKTARIGDPEPIPPPP